MRVKLKVSRSGHEDGSNIPFVQLPGEVVDMPDAEAERYVESGQAEAVEDGKKKKDKGDK